jgi:hypothetical protein
MNDMQWFTSSFSAPGNYVEVAHLPGAAGIALRDSRNRSSPPHFFTPDGWAAFADGMKNGEFDLP